jgi:hypothetical protein
VPPAGLATAGGRHLAAGQLAHSCCPSAGPPARTGIGPYPHGHDSGMMTIMTIIFRVIIKVTVTIRSKMKMMMMIMMVMMTTLMMMMMALMITTEITAAVILMMLMMKVLVF